MDKKWDLSACIVAGGEALRSRILQAQEAYSPMCEEYFTGLLAKTGKAFEESACGFLLLDELLQKNGLSRNELVISRNADGRPCVINRRDIDFSISHSEGAALCVVGFGADVKIGADIQHVRGYSDEKAAQLAEIFMGAADLKEYLKTRSEELFYSLWTRREAHIKMRSADVFADIRQEDLHTKNFSGGRITACGERYYYSVYIE